MPLFTMKGPEGQIFGPMADTYAFALGGALLLAVTLSPVLCLLLFKRLEPGRPNFLVRGINAFFLGQLSLLLRLRWLAVAGLIGLVALTGWAVSDMGREFMPELEEGNLWVRGTFPINISFEEVGARAKEVRRVLKQYPEVASIAPFTGRDDGGTDPTGYYNVEIFMPLRPEKEWPVDPKLGRPRTKAEVTQAMNDELVRLFPGVDWGFSQNIRDNVMEALSGVKGDNSVKIFGPDIAKLEEQAEKVKDAISKVPGVENVGIFHIQGQSNLEFLVDRSRCSQWNVSVADVETVIQSLVGGKACTQMVEGEKNFDITVRFAEHLRDNEAAILEIPVDVTNNQVTPASAAGQSPTPISAGGSGVSSTGSSASLPTLTGNQYNASGVSPAVPQRRLGDLVMPSTNGAETDSQGQFLRPGASTIYREQGQRFIAMKFDVRGRDLAGTVAEARAKAQPLVSLPYRAEWSGEFEEMEQAERRLVVVVSITFAAIVVLLFLAFRSVLDVMVVMSNVLAVSLGGLWALKVAHLNFNVSAAVGFISILGVAVMNGLIMVSSFNALRRTANH